MSQSSFCSRWVFRYLKYLLQRQCAGFQASLMSSARWTGTAGGPGCMAEQPGTGVPLEWRRCPQAWASPCPCIALSVTLCCLWNQQSLTLCETRAPAKRLEVLSAWLKRSCIRVESLPKAVLKPTVSGKVTHRFLLKQQRGFFSTSC